MKAPFPEGPAPAAPVLPGAQGAKPSAAGDAQLARLQHLIEGAAHLLPAQGPITVFIHHNTLHAFEDLPFDDAVKKGARLFGCHPYLPKERYREKLARGRIRAEDLSAALRADLGPRADHHLLSAGTRLDLRLAMLRYPIRLAAEAELRWFVAETDALRRFRDDVPPSTRTRFLNDTRQWVMPRRGDSAARSSGPFNVHVQQAVVDLVRQFGDSSMERWTDRVWEAFALQLLWRICRHGVHGVKTTLAPPPQTLRHRDSLLEITGEDSDELVHDVLIRFCAAFLDQGFADWPLPHREHGFWRAFAELYGQAGGPPDRWLRRLPEELARLQRARLGPLESIRESLQLLGVPEAEWEPFLSATVLALRGWAGMIRQIETRGDRVAHPVPAGSLVEFLAVRLILERLALAHVARGMTGFHGPLQVPLRSHKRLTPSLEQRAFLVFQLAQVLGWSPGLLSRLNKSDWAALMVEIEAFSDLERRRIFHLAFEHRYRTQALDALTLRARQSPAACLAGNNRAGSPFQAIFCIDEREESFRRHLEELAPEVETYGAAGFFGVAMYYRGVGDAHAVPLCPIVIRPQHWVEEDVADAMEDTHRRREKRRRALGAAALQVHLGSRRLTLGALLAMFLGLLASIPMIARILFPRWTARLRRRAARLVRPPRRTLLQLERFEAESGPEAGHVGYSVDEMAGIAERLLRDIGLTSGFARLVFVFGHGSSSLNNPHESAHDCGACGGGRGGPNARALAQMINDPRVRDRLARRGLLIPINTIFVGAYHNTCDESITYFDVDRLFAHEEEFAEARRILDQARERNAHERCRRFESAPARLSVRAALRHVEARAEDLAQVRPEYGHATNALCIVGRRARTRGLFLDRRAFLVSYDPTQDDAESAIVTRILQAVVPVCAGISLEYYFSYVDPTGWGCGTKLPHNITARLGIMDGTASDLRPGLPWQMVEIHEPVRLLLVVETRPETLLRIMDLHPAIGKLCRNGWIQVATLDPDSPTIHLFRDGRFQVYQPQSTELPRVAASADWYAGSRDHLGFAIIGE